MKTEGEISRFQREHRLVVAETIGCALATLGRLDHVWYDEDVRDEITRVRSALAITQTQIKERIAE